MVTASYDVVVVGAEKRGHVVGDSLPSLDELRAGDETAYERLVTVLSPWMRYTAGKHVHSAGLAEDIVQETWLAVLRGLDAFQGRSSLGWPSAGPAASPAQPDDLVIADEAARTILAAIAALPPRDAQVIALRGILGLSAPEAATRLGISTGNQRVLLHRARVRLRAMLRTCAEDQDDRKASAPIRQAGKGATLQRSTTPPPPRSQRPIRPRQTGRPTAVQVSERADPHLTPFTSPRRRPP